jgi:hypothetical protein
MRRDMQRSYVVIYALLLTAVIVALATMSDIEAVLFVVSLAVAALIKA